MNKSLKILTNKYLLLAVLILSAGFLVFYLTGKNRSKQAETLKQKSSFQDTLAINTDKSQYLPGERMAISMASLDNTGHTLCRSNLKLEITDPENKTEALKIINSPTCGDDNVTNDPDYLASQTLEKTGQYKLKLTNLDTGKTTEIEIKVMDSLSIDIKRSGATRINPFKSDRYPMIITVKANMDYRGQIEEQIPANFKIVWQGDAQIIEKAGQKTLTWEVDLKKGETKEFKYEYAAPKVSPAIYTLGPIHFQQSSNQAIEQSSFIPLRENLERKLVDESEDFSLRRDSAPDEAWGEDTPTVMSGSFIWKLVSVNL